ncbi:Chromosome partition protein Smc [Polystyrenella longa]|uniref:Chromosome partition protein Smc n=1 Tax=Polystyrenella longa TaxID=2528007 RepID=A0A518CJI8_9PLAN|nr:c-type cytochrome domain-containing protein [Polystyrenella longa]QDU79380.1 Chromosome partition protein Smc [Polystyrenella longa]
MILPKSFDSVHQFLPRTPLLAAVLLLAGSPLLVYGDDKPINYQDHVQPILRAKCFSCHNTNKKVAGLDLTSYNAAMIGGASGEVVDPGSPSDSYLYMLITHDSEPVMPPNSDKMPENELAIISKWIEGGAIENAGGKPRAMKKKANLGLTGAPTERPEGPAPMPLRISKEAVVHTDQVTAVTAMATNPWSSLVAVAGQQQIVLYDAANLEMLGVLPFPEGDPLVLKFSRNGGLLMAAGGRGASLGKAIVWDIRTGERVIEVGDELDAVLAADISADQTMIALGGSNKLVRIYSTGDGSLLHEMKKHTDWVCSLEFSPDGVLLATADRNGGMFTWESFTGRQYAELKGHTDFITDVSWRGDSNLLASVSLDGSLRLWEPENGTQVKTWSADGAGVESVEFTRDSRLLTGGRSKVTTLWDVNGGKLRDFAAFSDYALEVTFSDETNRVIAGDWNGEIRVWNAEDGAQLGQLNQNPAPLQARLDSAKAEFVQIQQTHQKNAEAAKVANDALAAVQKQSTDAAAALKQTADAHAEMIKTRDAAKQNLDKLAAEHTTTTQRVAELKKVMPLLSESAAKMKQAAEQSVGDEQLAKAAADVTLQKDTKTNELAVTEKKLAEVTPVFEKAKQVHAAAEQGVVETLAKKEVAQKTADGLVEPLKVAQETATAANAVANESNNKLQASQQLVAKWTGEIDFHQKLVALKERKTQKEEVVITYEDLTGQLQQLEGELQQAQDGLAAAQNKLKATNEQVVANQTAVEQATANQQAGEQTVAKAEATVPQLNETLQKAELALQTSGDDADLKQAVEQWKQLIAKKTTELATHKTNLVNLVAALEQAKQALVVSQELVPVDQQAIVAAEKQVADKTAAVAPVKEQVVAAKQKVDEANNLVAAIQQEVDLLRDPNPQTAQSPEAAPQ